MAKGSHRLTALEVRQAIKRGAKVKLGDGAGLTLVVTAPGSAKWILRYMRDGKAREMGLGPGTVPLADARAAAADAQRILIQDRDPIEVRHAAQATQRAAEADAARAVAKASERSFQAVAEKHIQAHAPGWKRPLHARQWRQGFELHAYPKLGDMDVAVIGRNDVLGLLQPLWGVMPETAGRLRGRIEAVMDYAIAAGLRDAGNPAVWRGGLKALLPPKRKVKPTTHQPSLPYQQVGGFVRALRQQPGTAALAFRLAIATACRTAEVIGACWSEFDDGLATWTIPAGRMKMAKPHRVPLSAEARNAIMTAHGQRLENAEFVFPGLDGKKPLSNMALIMLLRRMQGDGPKPLWLDPHGRRITAHGFRSSFRDWAGEATTAPREVAEACLAHMVGNAVEQAYARSDLLEKRRILLESWSDYLSRQDTAKVITMRRRVKA